MRRAESVRELRTARCRRSKEPISTAASFFDSQITSHPHHRHSNRHPSRRHHYPSRRHRHSNRRHRHPNHHHRHPNRRCSIGRSSNRYCSNRRSNSTAEEAEEHSSSSRRPHPNWGRAIIVFAAPTSA